MRTCRPQPDKLSNVPQRNWAKYGNGPSVIICAVGPKPCNVKNSKSVSQRLSAGAFDVRERPDKIWKRAQRPTHHGVKHVVPIGDLKCWRHHNLPRSSTCEQSHTNSAAEIQEHISGARHVAIRLHVTSSNCAQN